MNILIYSSQSRFSPKSVGGAETSLELIAEKMTDLGEKVVFATLGTPEIKGFRKKVVNGIPVYRLPYPIWPYRVQWLTPLGLKFWSARRLKFLASVIKKEKIDIVHCYEVRDTFEVLAARRIYKLKVKVVKRVAGAFWSHALTRGLVSRQEVESAFNSSDAVNYLSRASRDHILKEAQSWNIKLRPQKEIISDIGIDLNLFSPRPKTDKNGTFRIVYVGRFAFYQKIPNLLIEALTKVSHKNFRVDFIGVGADLEKCQTLCRELGMEGQFIFHGFLSQKKVAQIVSAADLFVLPTKHEGLPKALLEAMALGVPSLSSDVIPVNQYIKDGVNGYLVGNTVQEWAQKLDFIQERTNDELAKITANARESVLQNCNADKNILKYREEFNRLLVNSRFLETTPGQLAFSIVTILHNKEKELPYFLESILRQTFQESIEVVMVDDQSSDHSLAIAQGFAQKCKDLNKNISVTILKNEKNLGNCISRNKGIRAAKGDFLVITDADCVLSKNFLEEYRKHLKNADMVVSNYGIESGSRPVMETLASYEENLSQVHKDRKIQDEEQFNSFLNCVTRGVAFRRYFAPENLYDPRFGYVASDYSGFGWEDIDAGYRLFRQGAKISFTSKAFTMHVTHPSQVEKIKKLKGTLRNYRRLHQKNPQLWKLKKDWSLQKYQKICSSLFHYPYSAINTDMLFLDSHFKLGIFSWFAFLGQFTSPKVGSWYRGLKEKAIQKGQQKGKLVVYTAIFGKRDRLKNPRRFPGVDYVCFTDDPGLRSEIWKIIFVDKQGDPRRLAKIYKILPHRYFKDYACSLWVDATHIPTHNPLKLAKRFLKKHDVAAFAHHKRSCVYEEAQECLTKDLDDPNLIESQITKYRNLGYPNQNGLATCTIIFRKHNEQRIKDSMEEWWQEIEGFSVRDQLSFNFIIWKNKLNYKIIDRDVYDNKYFSFMPHIGIKTESELVKLMVRDRLNVVKECLKGWLTIERYIGLTGILIKKISPNAYYFLKRRMSTS